MKCHDWQELILTDYIDNQMGKNEKGRLEEHLSSCQQCREFVEAARKTLIEPFDCAEKVEPPEAIWHNIQEGISGADNEGRFVSLWDQIKEFGIIVKPAMAFTMIALLISGVTLMLRGSNQQVQIVKSVSEQSQIEDIDYVLDELVYFSEENNLYEETDIEEYFL